MFIDAPTTPAGFVPVQYTVGSYAGMLLGSLAIQEVARYGLWALHS
jgi:hypothetical protein